MTDRVALVTAAADGIGASTALAFARAGYRVVLADVNEDGARSTASQLEGEHLVLGLDVTDESAVGEGLAKVLAVCGRIDALANVVGGSRPGKTVADLSLAEWMALLNLNLTSTFLMCRAVIPTMRAQGSGAIVNVSSGAGLRGMKRNPGYVAAKGGVAALTRALAIDHGPEGIRVNGVAPGPIRTPLMRRNRTPDEIAAMGGLSLTGRIGEPEEIANTIVWLAGDAASYVMGQTIEVDGGPSAII